MNGVVLIAVSSSTVSGVVTLVAAAALLAGLFFLFVGALGVYRFPDAYHRLHAASKCTTLGLTGMLIAACLHIPDPIVVSKALITIALTFVANPIGSHLIAKAAHHAGLPVWERTRSDELAEDKADPSMAVSDAFVGAPGLDGPNLVPEGAGGSGSDEERAVREERAVGVD